MARTYKRDSRGRFASGGGSGSGRPATKGLSTGKNRLTRDNSGRITGQGGSGATARGGRLKTAAGNARARQVGRLKGAPAGTVSRGGKARGAAPVAKAKTVKPAARVTKKAAAEAKLDRVIARAQNIGFRRFDKEGRSERARNAVQVERRARNWINMLGTNTRKPPKTVAEMKANAAKVMADRKKVKAKAEIQSTKWAISRSRAQRAPKFDQTAIQRRRNRVIEADKRRGGISNNATIEARNIYDAQLRGQLPKQRGALLPGMKAAGQRARNANVVRGAKPKVGAPKGGAGAQIRARGKRGGQLAAPSGPSMRQRLRAAAKVKLSPMQRSEAKYAKRKYGVSSTVSNPGRPSMRLPRRTTSGGARIAVRGNKAATTRAYKQRVSATLGNTRKTDMATMGIGGGLRKLSNPRIRKQQTGMTQLSLVGRNKPLVRFRPANGRR